MSRFIPSRFDDEQSAGAEQPDSTVVDSGEGIAVGAPDAEFVELFVKAQRRVYLFLLAQTADPQSAEEILQNTNVVILSKWNNYTPGTNFLAWVYRVATLELLKYRQHNRRSRLHFDDEFLNTVAVTVQNLPDSSDERRQALSVCLNKLRPRDRQMILLKYQMRNDGKMLSEKLQRPINSIYQSLGRIRRTLLECIERELAAVGRS